MSQALRNTHPVDELANIRRQIKLLEDREKIVRHHIMTDPSDRVGSLYEATVNTLNKTSLDSKALMEALPAAMWQPYIRNTTYDTVKLKELDP